MWFAVTLLLVANVINLGADLSAMGDSMNMLTGGSAAAYTVALGFICVGLEVFLDYKTYSSALKWATLSLFAYIAVAAVAHIPWGTALKALFVPEVERTSAYATGFVAILGTTISPYLFFWQAAQEVEEERRHHAKPLCIVPAQAGPELRGIRNDTLVGMAFSTIISVAIVFATAATLNANGITNIETSSQAAQALRPIAGDLASLLFAVGIIGTGMLAVPVLAGSAAYALTEMFGIASSLDAKPAKARFFYAVIAATTFAGASLEALGINPVKALYWSAVVNGVLAVPLMMLMMLIVRNPRAMGRLTIGSRMTIVGWAATAVMAVASAIFFWSLL
jgi:Mn2+/Fe2+ NRAMP family transporter